MKRDNLFGILWDIAFISAFILSSSFANALCGDSVCENRSALASFIITEGENAFFYNLTIRQSLDYRNNITNNSFTIILRDANDKWNNLLIFQEGNGIINATKGIPVSINENISLLVYSLNWTNEKDTCPEDCITQQICGDSICDSSESLNCCIDCGCSDGINCIGNVCTPPTNNSFVPVNPPFPEPNSPNKLPFTLLLAGGIFAVVVVVGSTAGIVSHKKNKEKKKEEYYKKMLLQKYIHQSKGYPHRHHSLQPRQNYVYPQYQNTNQSRQPYVYANQNTSQNYPAQQTQQQGAYYPPRYPQK